MIADTKLPPDCIVHRSCTTDKWTVINLIFFGVSRHVNSVLTAAIFLILYALVLFVLGIGFVIIVFGIFNEGYSLPIKVGIIALHIWLIINWIILPRKLFSKTGLWLIESNGLVVGYGLISRHKTYSILRTLYIVPTHRN